MMRLAIAAFIAAAGIGAAHAEPPRAGAPRTVSAPVLRQDPPAQTPPPAQPPSWGRAHAQEYSTANGG